MAALRVSQLGVLLVGAALAGGCASFVRPDGPRTMAPGASQFSMATSAYVGTRKDSNIFNIDGLYRVGLARRVDLGLRGSLMAVAADVKVQLARAPDPTWGVDLAVAPSIGSGGDITWTRGSNNDLDWSAQVGLPLLVGINLGRHQLLLTPQLLYQRASVLPDGVLHLGGTVGYGQIGDRGFSVYPVLAIWKTLDPRRVVGSLSGPGPLMFQPALVMRWGP